MNMSGTVRVRKQWQIQEGPRGTLRKLRNQLAEDGCVESQVVIAKHLLEEAQDSGSWTETTTQAVHWLMKASEHGNEEATVLLRNCFNSGAGITEENLKEVKVCLNMSAEEKAFRSAARDMFTLLTPFGQEFVTTSQLRAKLFETECSHTASISEKKEENGDGNNKKDEVDSAFTRWYQESNLFDGEHLTEDRLAEIAGEISQGELPSISLTEAKIISQQRQSRLVERVFRKLKEAFSEWSSRSLDFIAQHGDKFLLSLLPWGQLRVVGLVLLCSLLPLETIVYLLPMLTFYVSMFVMALSSLQLVSDRKRLHIFMMWLHILQLADANLPTLTAEKKFCIRRLRPYLTFFISAITMLVAYPLSNGHALPHSEITALCSGFAILCLVGLNEVTLPVLGFASVSFLLMALRLAWFMNWCGTSGILGLVTAGWQIEVTDQIVLHLSLAKLLAVLFLAICIWMASAEFWHGSYKLLLPNLVACTWMQLLVVFFPHSTWTGISQGALLLTAAIVLPVVLIVLILTLLIYAVVVLVSYLSATAFSMHLLTTCGIILLTVVSKWFAKRRHKEVWKKWLTRLQIACGIFAALQFIPAFQTLSFSSDRETVAEFMDWQVYHQSCHQPAWNEFTIARVQEYCSHLHGSPVAWQGQVKHIKIQSIRNHLEEALDVLPRFVASRLRCIYGIPYEACSIDDMSEYHFRLCTTIAKTVQQKCHLKQWNVYEFEVAIQMSGGYWNSAEVVLVAEDAFKDFIFHLNAGDDIKFKGLLHGNVGGLRPSVLLKSVACEDCAFNMDPVVAHRQVKLHDKFHDVYHFLFNFFFQPFMRLKQPRNDET